MQTCRKGVVQVKEFGKGNYKITYCNQLVTGKRPPSKTLVKKGEGNHVEKLGHSISRSKSKVLEYALCNDWVWFVTLTLNPEKYQRDDLQTFISDLGQFIRNQRKKFGIEIKYLLIPELHKDGKNWHMHGLFSELPINDLEPHPLPKLLKKGYLNWSAYEKKFGFNSIGQIHDPVKCSMYIVKYITKNVENPQVDLNKKLYYNSRGLNTAKKIAEGQLIKPLNICFDFEGPFCKATFVDTIEWFKDYYKEYENYEIPESPGRDFQGEEYGTAALD